MKSTVVVNATALDTSGALTVLQQFLAAIPTDNHWDWIVWVSDRIKISIVQSNIQIIPVTKVKSFIRRFWWDAFGIRQWLKRHGIVPTISLSLQNTNFRTGYDIPNYVYYHQSIPFNAHQWSILRGSERILWFYKNIYPFFVRLFLNRHTEIFVQLEYIKEAFSNHFNFNHSKIHIITPTIVLPQKDQVAPCTLPSESINLFYPATGFFYKNHLTLFRALNRTEKTNFVLHLTLNQSDLPQIERSGKVHYMGQIPFEKVLSMYAGVDALVFPSTIETYGLPLVEAAALGVPIIVADLPYAREVLKGYEGVKFIAPFDAKAWSQAFDQLQPNQRFKPFIPEPKKSWPQMIKIITKQ